MRLITLLLLFATGGALASTPECVALRGAIAIRDLAEKSNDLYAGIAASGAVERAIVDVQTAIREGRLHMSEEATAIAATLAPLAGDVRELVHRVVDWGNARRDHDVTLAVGGADRRLRRALSHLYLLAACGEG